MTLVVPQRKLHLTEGEATLHEEDQAPLDGQSQGEREDTTLTRPSQLDPFSRLLGMRLVDVGPGYATVQMTVHPELMNPHGTPHGGAIFSLADSALALASNSRGQEAVALDVSITYCRPALEGSVLTATATEQNVTRRTGLFDLRVVRDDGKLVASARGTVFYTGRPFKGWN